MKIQQYIAEPFSLLRYAVLVYLICTGAASLAQPINIYEVDTSYSYINHLEFIDDAERKLTFDQVRQLPFAQYDRQAQDKQTIRWYRFEVNPQTSFKELVFFVGIVDKSDIYVPYKSGYKHFQKGLIAEQGPVNNNRVEVCYLRLPMDSLNFSKPFYFNNKILTFSGNHYKDHLSGYLKGSNNAERTVYLDTLGYTKSSKNYEILVYFMLLSCFTFLVHFILFWDKNYLFYSLYLYFSAGIFFTDVPILKSLLNQISPAFTSIYNNISIVLASGFYYLFVVTFIQLSDDKKKYKKYLLGICYFSFLYAIAYTLIVFIYPYFPYRFTSIAYFRYTFVFVSILTFIWYFTLKTTRLEKIILFGSLLLIVGNALTVFTNNSLYFIVTSLLEILVFYVALAVRYKQNFQQTTDTLVRLEKEKLEKENLKSLNATKSDFFASISHEFRTPLTLIIGPIQKLLESRDVPISHKENYQMIAKNSKRLLNLVDQLLDIAKLESGNIKLKISKSPIMSFIGNLTDGFTYLAEQKDIDFQINLENNQVEVYFDKDIVEKIVINLLSNAIKYTPPQGKIICNASIVDSTLFTEIKNTGKGLTEKELNKIFERFYQKNDSNDGVGIGLALVKELVAHHKGRIKVISIPDQWTTFTVEIPVDYDTYAEEKIIKSAIDQKPQEHLSADSISIYKEPISINGQENNDLPILLIVDDNPDVLAYVRSIFAKNYKIQEAENGEEGIKKALQIIPDLIISDIMMPVKNGIELCETLKTNELTSHIPIILLTAKVGQENELEGISTGADDYIAKPFNEKLLKEKVKNLITLRKLLQLRYSQAEPSKTDQKEESHINNIDQQFLDKLNDVLHSNLEDNTFTIEDFCQSIGISRMQLHRKLKALTGMSASAYIKTQRLKIAANLLKAPDVRISEVGYSVGFSSHTYFSKSFKELYDCTPSEYSEKS